VFFSPDVSHSADKNRPSKTEGLLYLWSDLCAIETPDIIVSIPNSAFGKVAGYIINSWPFKTSGQHKLVNGSSTLPLPARRYSGPRDLAMQKSAFTRCFWRFRRTRDTPNLQARRVAKLHWGRESNAPESCGGISDGSRDVSTLSYLSKSSHTGSRWACSPMAACAAARGAQLSKQAMNLVEKPIRAVVHQVALQKGSRLATPRSAAPR
jgi:hypothetical protein